MPRPHLPTTLPELVAAIIGCTHLDTEIDYDDPDGAVRRGSVSVTQWCPRCGARKTYGEGGWGPWQLPRLADLARNLPSNVSELGAPDPERPLDCPSVPAVRALFFVASNRDERIELPLAIDCAGFMAIAELAFREIVGLDSDPPVPMLYLTEKGERELVHWSRVLELAASCRCGHDRGDHLVDEPHGCEAHDSWGPCPCRAYQSGQIPARLLERAAAETLPAPPPEHDGDTPPPSGPTCAIFAFPGPRT